MEDIVIENKEFGMFSKANLDYKKDNGEKKKKKKNTGMLLYFFNIVSYFLICFSLLAADFVLFASSGAINIFSDQSSLISEALYILIALGVVVAILCFILSFLTILQTLMAAIVVYMTSYAVFNQFANFASYDGQSGTYISVVLSAIAFAVLLLGNKSVRALVTLVAVFFFGAVLVNQNQNKDEFLITTTSNVNALPAGDEADERIIYFMMPNLPSYAYVNGLTEMEASKPYKDQLMSVILAFYAKNAFKLYPNAYVTQTNPFVNAVLSLNYTDENWKKLVQNQILKGSYWQFKNKDDFTVYMAKNRLFDELKAKNYKINAYQSRAINLCKKENQDNVSRCLTKVNLPVNIPETTLSLDDKTQVLLGQWLESTGWFEYGVGSIYSYAKAIYNPNKTPILGMSYKKLYVINSMKVLDNLLADISHDKGKNAYFVYLDMPADAFVYDEMCRLKSTDTWLNKESFPWIDNRNTLEKRNAYLRQTVCLFGKLEQIIDTMRKDNMLDNTSIIIQGLNGADDLIASPEVNAAESFKNLQMVNMAIREPKSGKFVINKAICSVPNILNTFFGDAKNCEEFAGTSLSKTSKAAINSSLSLVRFNNEIAQKSLQVFNTWYKEWKKANPLTPKVDLELPVESILVPTESKREFDNMPPAEGPRLLPMEEKVITKSNVMKGQVNVKPEAATKSFSESGGM